MTVTMVVVLLLHLQYDSRPGGGQGKHGGVQVVQGRLQPGVQGRLQPGVQGRLQAEVETLFAGGGATSAAVQGVVVGVLEWGQIQSISNSRIGQFSIL